MASVYLLGISLSVFLTTSESLRLSVGSDTGSGLAAVCSLLREQEFPHGCTSATCCLCCGATTHRLQTTFTRATAKQNWGQPPAPASAGSAGKPGQRREWDNIFVTSTGRKISKCSQRGPGKYLQPFSQRVWTELVITVNTAGRTKHMAWDKSAPCTSHQQLPAKNQWASKSHSLQSIWVHLMPVVLLSASAVLCSEATSH